MIHPRTLQALEYGKVAAYIADLCVSTAGRARAQHLAPLADALSAEQELELYSQATVWNAACGFPLVSFPDVSGILEVCDGMGARDSFDLDAFWAMREMLREAQKAVSSINQPQGVTDWPALLALATATPLPETLLAALNRCISDDGRFKDESSPELWRIRNELRSLHQNCLRKVKDFARQYNIGQYLQDEFMTLASDRYVLPLKANFKGRLQGIIHDWSQTGETCYFEPIFLVDINNRLRELKREEAAEERNLLDYLAGLLAGARDGAKASYDLLGQLDFINAKKLMAQYLDCHVTAFTPVEEGVSLLSARHPLLALARQDAGTSLAPPSLEPARPLDILLAPGERVLIITGGNAGGKTVCLKTMGLIAAMAMSGLPVPVAQGSHLPWFDRIDAFIGDEQSLDDNVSTFTAQIDHLAKAWKHLDNRGLALLDEFGAGTDPAEGAALAQGVLDGLLEKHVFVLCATHFPALKSYALTMPGVAAASMLFNPQTHKPLFKLAYGQVGSSQALTVAEEHGLPESILKAARHYLLQAGEDSGALVTRLNALAAEREREIASLREDRAKAKAILAEKREKLDNERARLQTETREKIASLMAAWKEGKATAKQTMREMSQVRADLLGKGLEEKKSILPAAEVLAVGKRVFHAVFNKRGVITELDERRQRVRLDIDGVSLWADMKDLRDSGAVEKRPAARGATVRGGASGAAMTLDVRGMRAEEAIAEVTRFLDKAILAGYSELEIVHGRGTGALRREIHAFLRSFPGVASAVTAPEDRGGDGMTMVTLA